MDFNLSAQQLEWQEKAQAFARELSPRATAGDIIAGAARAGLVDPRVDLLSAVVAVEALAWESAGAAVALAIHTGVATGVTDRDVIERLDSLPARREG